METQEQSILCPDCGVNYIDITRFNVYKKCISCARRETIASTKNVPYIKWKDLPESERKRLEKQREDKNKSYKEKVKKHKKNKVNKVSGTILPANELVKKFLEHINYLDNYANGNTLVIKTTDIYNQFIVYCMSHYYMSISRQSLYNILTSKFGFKRSGISYLSLDGSVTNSEDMISVSNDENSKSSRVRYNQIYTPDILEDIQALASADKTVTELRDEIIRKYPDKNITISNFNNIISRQHIIHAGRRNYNKHKVETGIIMPREIHSGIVSNKDVLAKEPDTVDIAIKTTNDMPDRLAPVKDEVIKVLQTKFNAMKCKTTNDFNLEDYINMIELFIYLMHNIDTIITVRNNQYDITNWYQDEIVHEMENELAEEGNTYLQDKMYVLRDIRRYIESDRDALKQMRVFFKNLVKMFPEADAKKVVGQLKYISNNNKQPKFIPTVDLGMVKKYTWATYGSPSSPKNNKEIFTTNSVEKFIDEKSEDTKTEDVKTVKVNGTRTHLSQEEIDRGLKIYRVSCNISGGGYGAFKPWYKDYPCINSDIAMSFARQEFARMKASNKSLLFTDVDVHQLNVI